MKRLCIRSILVIVLVCQATQCTDACLGEQTSYKPTKLSNKSAASTLIINIANQGTVNIFIPNSLFDRAPEEITSALTQLAVEKTESVPTNSVPSVSPSLEIDNHGINIQGWNMARTLELLSLIAHYTFKTAVRIAYIIGDISYTYLFPTIKKAVRVLFDGIDKTSQALLFSLLGSSAQTTSRELITYASNSPIVEELANNTEFPSNLEIGYPFSIQEAD